MYSLAICMLFWRNVYSDASLISLSFYYLWCLSHLMGIPKCGATKLGGSYHPILSGSERIHLRWNKGQRSLLNTQQGSGRQDSKAETVCSEVVGGGHI